VKQAIAVSKQESDKSSFLDARGTLLAPHLHGSHSPAGIAVDDTRRAELHVEAPPIVDQSSLDTLRSSILSSLRNQSAWVSYLLWTSTVSMRLTEKSSLSVLAISAIEIPTRVTPTS
jgi:hypothetical protein